MLAFGQEGFGQEYGAKELENEGLVLEQKVFVQGSAWIALRQHTLVLGHGALELGKGGLVMEQGVFVSDLGMLPSQQKYFPMLSELVHNGVLPVFAQFVFVHYKLSPKNLLPDATLLLSAAHQLLFSQALID